MGKAIWVLGVVLAFQGAFADESPVLRGILMRRFEDLKSCPGPIWSKEFDPVADEILYGLMRDPPGKLGQMEAIVARFRANAVYRAATPAARSDLLRVAFDCAKRRDFRRAVWLLGIRDDSDERPVRSLEIRLASDPDPMVRDWAVRMLQPSDKASIEAICAMPQSVISRKLAWRQYDDLTSDAGALSLIVTLAGNPDWRVARGAIRALGQMAGSWDALEALLTRLSGDCAAQALASLCEVDAGRARSHVLACAGTTDNALRWKALELCGKFDDPESRAVVMKGLRSPNCWDRVACLGAVGILKDRERQTALWAGLHDRSGSVREFAVSILPKELPVSSSMAWLVPMLSDPDGQVGARAIWSLFAAAGAPRSAEVDSEFRRIWPGVIGNLDWDGVRRGLRSRDMSTAIAFAQFVALWYPERGHQIPLTTWDPKMGLWGLEEQYLIRCVIATHTDEEILEAPVVWRRAVARYLALTLTQPMDSVPGRALSTQLMTGLWQDTEQSVRCAFYSWLVALDDPDRPWVEAYKRFFGRLPVQFRREAFDGAPGVGGGWGESVEESLRPLLQDADWEVRHHALAGLKAMYWSSDYLALKRRNANSQGD